MKRFPGGKRRITVAVVALLALSVGVSLALATSGPSQVKSTLHLRQNGVCPGPFDKLKKKAGTVKINNEKGEWRIVVHMRGALPGEYHIDVLDSTCTNFLATGLGDFKVQKDGSGDEHLQAFAVGFQSFFVAVHESAQDIWYYTPMLKIGGNPK